MFLEVRQFVDVWQSESATTRRVMGRLTDQALTVRVARQARNAAETAWHIAAAIRDIGTLMGLRLSGPKRGDAVPQRAAEIASAYERASAELLDMIAAWSDDNLQLTDDVYGERWSRGWTLYILVAHEIHHRGQLTALLRAAGLTVPAVYGPSLDEEYRPVRPS